MNKKTIVLIFSISTLLWFSSCSDEKESGDDFLTTRSEVLTNYADLVFANYADAHAGAVDLKAKIDAFVASPDESTHEAAKDAWLAARETYGQTEAFRFYGGPIDDEDGPEGQLNAWPLDEAHIDYVNQTYVAGSPEEFGDVRTNIINNTSDFPSITVQTIIDQNENPGETNVSSGYHAVEFLLWGQDESDGAGGGERPFSDYIVVEGGTNENQERRAEYLQAAAQLIIDDLQSLMDEWEEGGTYRTTFLEEEETSLANIISALGKLSFGELAGERMFVAVDLQSKENEHSCFSDNTHRDIVANALGIQNVFLGRYTSSSNQVTGDTGIYELLLIENEALAERLKSEIANSVALAQQIQAPFDQEILASNPAGQARINATIDALQKQGASLAEAPEALLNLSFNPEDI